MSSRFEKFDSTQAMVCLMLTYKVLVYYNNMMILICKSDGCECLNARGWLNGLVMLIV